MAWEELLSAGPIAQAEFPQAEPPRPVEVRLLVSAYPTEVPRQRVVEARALRPVALRQPVARAPKLQRVARRQQWEVRVLVVVARAAERAVQAQPREEVFQLLDPTGRTARSALGLRLIQLRSVRTQR
jgi:hypothetical protein